MKQQFKRRLLTAATDVRPTVWRARLRCAATLLLAAMCAPGRAADDSDAIRFRKDIEPLLVKYCYDCHGDGMKKGDLAFDELKSNAALFNHQLWGKVLKNVRANLMPPAKKPRPTAEELAQLEQWIKSAAFGIDFQNLDPGRVTVRRLNRTEYRNTIRDLMGVDFNSNVEFPPDDTGYGFDNIGDVLTVSPMLLEIYMAAATTIVKDAVPTVSRMIRESTINGNRFRSEPANAAEDQRRRFGDRILSFPYDQPAAVSTTFRSEHSGAYQLGLDVAVKGEFDFDARKCRVLFKLDGRELTQKEFSWQNNKTYTFNFDESLQPGEHRLDFEIQPIVTPDVEGTNSLFLRLNSVVVRGPKEEQYWTRSRNYDRFFTREPPTDPAERRAYAREVLGNFTRKAYRRPVDDRTVERLVTMAEEYYKQPGKTFEAGAAHAIVAVLASPRFLFRIEENEKPEGRKASALVDEYSLASRLSYFLWSSMPDDELMNLATRNELRKNLNAQVKRLLADSRSEALVQNFTGQWLQVRDVEGISIDARAVLLRDSGQEREFRAARAARQQQQQQPPQQPQPVQPPANAAPQTNFVAQMNALTQTNASATNQLAQAQPQPPAGGRRGFNRGRFFRPRVELDRDLRQAMQRETEMYFGGIVHEDRSVKEILDSDYTYLNEKLAGFYGLTNLGVTGSAMRRVTLPADSPRGGVLTHGSVLVVTSNPDRTSPVKRGLFVLDNILGTSSPPPPANVPALEAAEKDLMKDHDPLLRDALALHRNSPLCASCHARLDPIGLAFENFNAMGMWRDKERNQPIDASGKLVTGETFSSVRELRQILANDHRLDFYRCLTEKLLTYAVGRGMEHYDTETMDRIVQQLDRENGRFSALLMGIIESAPFQRQRIAATATSEADASPGPALMTASAETEGASPKSNLPNPSSK